MLDDEKVKTGLSAAGQNFVTLAGVHHLQYKGSIYIREASGDLLEYNVLPIEQG